MPARQGGGVRAGGKGGLVRAVEHGQHVGNDDARNNRGPIGANGSRPLLGPYGAARRNDHNPLSGKAAGSHAGDAGGSGATIGGKEFGPAIGKGSAKADGKGPNKGDLHHHQRLDGGHWAWQTPRNVMEEGGFTLVQPRKARGKGGDELPQVAGPKGAEQAPVPAARQRWSDVESDDGEDEDMDDERDVAHWGEEAEATESAAAECDPRQLRASYEELSKAVRNLEKRGGFAHEGTAMRALKEARDRAEAAWRTAKTPAPLPTRMAWAEAKLERAAAALTKARYAVEELDADYERQREALCQRVEQADAWHKWRQRQVDDLHNEAADKAPSRRRVQANEGGAEVREKIRDQLLPELQSIMDHVEGNPEILEKLSMLAAGLVDAESRLEDRPSDATIETFDMAEADSEDNSWGTAPMGNAYKGESGEPHGKAKASCGGGKGKASEWRSDGPGRWTRAAAASKAVGPSAEATPQAAVAGAAAQAEGGTEAGGAADTTAGGMGARGHDQGGATADAPTDSGDEDGKPPKHRRRQSDEDAKCGAREASDRKRAEELRAQQAAAAAAQIESYNAGAGGFGSEVALSLAAQKFVVEVQGAQRRAARQGVEPRAEDGRALLELTPMELQRWVEANLGEDDEY